MTLYEFTLLIEPVQEMGDAFVDALYANCDDSLIVLDEQSPAMDFAREADSYLEAVISAIADVEETEVATVVRVEPEDLVSASQIAKRTGRSRESIRLLYEGERGPGDFPEPLNPELKSRLWRWPEVRAWMAAYDKKFADTLDSSREELQEQERIRAGVNAMLEARRRFDSEEIDFVYTNIAAPLEELEPDLQEFLDGFVSIVDDVLASTSVLLSDRKTLEFLSGLDDEVMSATSVQEVEIDKASVKEAQQTGIQPIPGYRSAA